jgi:hypothetical protein
MHQVCKCGLEGSRCACCQQQASADENHCLSTARNLCRLWKMHQLGRGANRCVHTMWRT